MKIGPLENPHVAAPAIAERRAEGAKPAATGNAGNAAAGNAAASAKVELSSTAAALAGAAVGEPSFDQAKVDRIAQAIREGKFEVNAGVIADKLIANAQDLLGRNGR